MHATATALPTAETTFETPPAITLAQLLEVLGSLTDDEDEIVATMLHMVERGSVRLVTPPTPTAL